MADRTWGFRTRVLHAGGPPDPTTGARIVAVSSRRARGLPTT